MPKKGKRTMGSRAVTERGRASVHQYTAMSKMTNRQRPSCSGEMHQGASHGGSEKSGKLEVGGASRHSTGFGALEEGLISS